MRTRTTKQYNIGDIVEDIDYGDYYFIVDISFDPDGDHYYQLMDTGDNTRIFVVSADSVDNYYEVIA